VLFASCTTALVIRRRSCRHRVAAGRELVSSSGAFVERLIAVALEHQVGGAPDIDLGYHAEKTAGLRSRNASHQQLHGLRTYVSRWRHMAPILTAEEVVRRIAAECAYVDDRGGVGIRLKPAVAIVRQYGEQFRRPPPRKRTRRPKPTPLL
jgi:hypothetical protein